MQIFIAKPNINLYPGIRVTADTVLEFENEFVTQRLENLVLHTVATREGEGFKSINDTFLYLNEGDILLYENEGRGYIKPVDGFCTIAEAIEDLESMRDLGDKDV